MAFGLSKHPNPKDIYFDQLEKEGHITSEHATLVEAQYMEFLTQEFEESKKNDKALVYDFLSQTWAGYRHGNSADFDASPATGVAMHTLLDLGKKLFNFCRTDSGMGSDP